MYIISLEKKTETNQGQPWATSAARQGDLLHMLESIAHVVRHTQEPQNKGVQR